MSVKCRRRTISFKIRVKSIGNDTKFNFVAFTLQWICYSPQLSRSVSQLKSQLRDIHNINTNISNNNEQLLS